jgi:hypothetical protein
METLCFFVRDDVKGKFEVIIRKDGRNLHTYCSCPSGGTGRLCRHRYRILSGNREGVVSDNAPLVDIAHTWMWRSDVVDDMGVMEAAAINCDLAQKQLSNRDF